MKGKVVNFPKRNINKHFIFITLALMKAVEKFNLSVIFRSSVLLLVRQLIVDLHYGGKIVVKLSDARVQLAPLRSAVQMHCSPGASSFASS